MVRMQHARNLSPLRLVNRPVHYHRRTGCSGVQFELEESLDMIIYIYEID